MNLTKLQLQNFRHFESFQIDFSQNNVTAIIGVNGTGKTTILDSIAICLTHFTGELLSISEGYSIDAWFQAKDITTGKAEGFCEVTFETKHLDSISKIRVNKEINEKGLKFEKDPQGIIHDYKLKIKNKQISSIPIIAYYNVNRTNYSDLKPKKAIKTYNKMLFAYERALSLNSPGIRDFEDWFIEQQILENSYKVEQKDLDANLPSLDVVRKALKKFMSVLNASEYSQLYVVQKSEIYADFSESIESKLGVKKNNTELLFSQLSHGERMIISLVSEIARRLYLANPDSLNPLIGDGVILIDELELHLHPQWQNKVLEGLTSTFPNLQFVITTHSPLILSGLRNNSISILNNKVVIDSDDLPDIYSATADEILNKLMFASISSMEFKDLRNEINRLFNELKIAEAEQKLDELKDLVKSNPEWLNDIEQKISFIKS